MKTKIVKNIIENTEIQYPRLVIHNGKSLDGTRNKPWEGAIAILKDSETGFVIHFPNSPTRLFESIQADTNSIWWQPFNDKLVLSND